MYLCQMHHTTNQPYQRLPASLLTKSWLSLNFESEWQGLSQLLTEEKFRAAESVGY
jgi:hypothetical protein